MCPLSNVRTGSRHRLGEHPIQRFYEEGLLVSVNTDDPKMFHTSMDEEYTALIDNLGFERSDIHQLIRNAIRSAWCDEETKKALRSDLVIADRCSRGFGAARVASRD